MNSRVPADRVRAVTVSKMGNEFIMHVPDGVDCRYDHPDKYFNLLCGLSC